MPTKWRKKTTQVLKLKKDDAAIVIAKDGKMTAYLPDEPEDTPVPQNTLMVGLCMVMFRDEKTLAFGKRRMKAILKQQMKKERK